VYALVCGVFKDLFSVQSFGMNALLFPLTAVVILRVRKEIEIDSPILSRLFLFVLVCVFEMVFAVLFSLQRGNLSGFTVIKIIFIEALYTVAFFCLVQKPLTKVLHL
jgi:rod shape-determining protein MreD